MDLSTLQCNKQTGNNPIYLHNPIKKTGALFTVMGKYGNNRGIINLADNDLGTKFKHLNCSLCNQDH